jgi:hypothetical protein
MSKEKYIGKSGELEGFGDIPAKPMGKKIDIEIESPVEETNEEYNAKILEIREEIKNAKILGPSVLVRFLKWSSDELQMGYDLIASEEGKMGAKRVPYQYSDYCVIVGVGEDCKYKDRLPFGTKCKVVNAVSATKKIPYEVPFSFSMDNYFMLNENLIAWYE